MKVKEMNQLNDSELKNLLKEKRAGLQSFYFKIAKGNVKNVKEAKGLRKDVARILTILRNKN